MLRPNPILYEDQWGMCFDPGRGLIAAEGAQYMGTYAYDGAQFQTIINANQTSSWRPMMCYDPGRGAIVLTGGFRRALDALDTYQSFPAATYLLTSDANAWSRYMIPTPHGRKYAPLVYDSLAQRIVMFGGTNHMANFRETWKLARGPAAVAAPPAPAAVSDGGIASFNIVARGGGLITYAWRRDGVPLHNDQRISGADTDTLTILHATRSDAGLYDCAVSNPCGQDTSSGGLLTIGCSADFNNDGDVGTDLDIQTFFACLAGDCCPTCGEADFNGDGDSGTDADIEAFFRVLAGGSC